MVGLAAALILSCAPVRAAQSYPEPAGADSAGFVPIFDGKTLAGWHKNPERIGHGTGGSWVVEEGVIAGEQDPPGSGNGGIPGNTAPNTDLHSPRESDGSDAGGGDSDAND